MHLFSVLPSAFRRPAAHRIGLAMAVLLLAVLVIGHALPVHASTVSGHTYYVAPTGSDGSPGTAAQPFLTIQHGINSSVSGDTVIVEDGTYTGPGDVDLDFGGKNITVTSQNGAASTVIDCQGSANANHRGFYFHSGETSAAVVSGLTIKNGYESNGAGGAVYVQSASVTLSNCTLTNNTAIYGGAIADYPNGGTVAVSVCKFTGNSASSGGAIANYAFSGSKITVTNCSISGNVVNSGGGAGIYNYLYGSQDRISISGCTIDANKGNGIENAAYVGIATISNCTITNNVSDYFGGGIDNGMRGGEVFVTNCMIARNSAGDGGGIYNDTIEGLVGISNCTLTGNTATSGSGGGVYNSDYSSYGTTVTISNCLLSGNTAPVSGGGIENRTGYPGSTSASTFIITGCTLSKNAAGAGGGLNSVAYGDTSQIIPISLTNDIFYGDAHGEIGGANFIAAAFCDIQGGYPGTNNFDADPLFVDAANGDYHLTSGSPCVGKGTSSAPGYLPYALDNQPRPNPPSIGAFEVKAARLVLTNLAVSRNGGIVTVTAKIQNYGNADATGARITQAKLAGVAATAPLPGPYTIAAGGSQTISLRFTTNLTGRQPVSIQGAANGLSFSAGQFLTIP